MRTHTTFILAALALAGCDQDPPRADKDPAAPTGSGTMAATADTKTTASAPAGSAMPAGVRKPDEKAKGPFSQSKHPAMTDPSQATEKAPDTFRAKFETTVGDFTVACTRAHAPFGADRFYNLVRIGFFDDVAFFRTVKGFVTQWGIHGDPAVSKVWSKANIEPDEVKESNKRGTLVFAQAGRPKKEGFTAEMRSTQLFINYGDNSRLDKMGFAPFCVVEGEGMSVVDKFYSGYGGRAGGDQAKIQSEGNPYLRKKYPKLDYIKKAMLLGDEEAATEEAAAKDDDAAEKPAATSPAASAPPAAKKAAPAAPKPAPPAPAPAAPKPAPP
ncbi:MAG: peptidylprolyl isomerase, partial [Myxococcota bacterium]